MKPLFLSELQERIRSLPEKERQEVRLLVWVNEKDEYRTLCFEMPAGERLRTERPLCLRYLLAMMNNLLVSFGGARLELYFDRDNPEMESLVEEAAAKFALYRSSYESQMKALEMVDQVPTLNVFYDPETVPAGYEYLVDFLAPLSVARPRGITPFYAAISSRIQIEASAVICDMKTPAEAVKDLEAGINSVIG